MHLFSGGYFSKLVQPPSVKQTVRVYSAFFCALTLVYSPERLLLTSTNPLVPQPIPSPPPPKMEVTPMSEQSSAVGNEVRISASGRKQNKTSAEPNAAFIVLLNNMEVYK